MASCTLPVTASRVERGDRQPSSPGGARAGNNGPSGLRGHLFLRVAVGLVDHHRAFDAGHDLHAAAAFPAAPDVDPEEPP